MGRNERVGLISQIETARQSRLLTYVTGDRRNAPATANVTAVEGEILGKLRGEWIVR